MAFEKKVPEWNAAGAEPPASLKNTGFQAGYKPPADYFNWFMYGVSQALNELQAMSPRDIDALAAEAIYYNSTTDLDLDTTTHSVLLVDRTLSKDCPLCTDSGFVFVMQLFFGKPSELQGRTQIAFSYGDGGVSAAKGIAIRCYFNGTWSEWNELYGPHNAKNIPLDNFAGPLSTTKGGTGGATAEAGFKNLFTRATVNTTNQKNANTLTASGIHMVYIDSEIVPNPATLNFPYYYGVLFVTESNAYVAQTFFSVSADPVYYRTSYNGGANWGDWKTIYTNKNSPSLGDLTGVLPIEHGGTGTTGWHQALTNLRAMERQAMYYSATLAPDIDTLTDSLMLIPYEYSKDCPVGGGFVYIMQLFYGDITASNNRTQVAFPYSSEGYMGKGMAIRAYFNGTWSEWKQVGIDAPEELKAGTLGGKVRANPTSAATVGDSQIRNINAGTTDLTAGSSALETGALYFVYE